MATNYQRGRAFEYRVRKNLLEKRHAVYVMRAAQSKGAADLIALMGDCTLLIQCKRDGRLPAKEKEVLLDIAERAHYPTVAVLAKTGPAGRGIVYVNLHDGEEM